MPERDPEFARFLYDLAMALEFPNADVGAYTPEELLFWAKAMRQQRAELFARIDHLTADLEDDLR